MRFIGRVFAATLFAFMLGAPADACMWIPARIPIFWNSPPEELAPDEVVLELEVIVPVYWTDSPQEHAERERMIPERIVAGEEVENPFYTSCERTADFAYRVKRVLHGSFPHSHIVISPGFDIWDENLQPRLNRIVVGQLADKDWLDRPAETQWFTTDLYDRGENKFESVVFVPRPPDTDFEPGPLARSGRWAQIIVFGGSQRITAALFGPPSVDEDAQTSNTLARIIPALVLLSAPVGLLGYIFVTRRRQRRSPP